MTETNHDVDRSLSQQRSIWRIQAGNLPPLRGGKLSWVSLVFELVEQVGSGLAYNMEQAPSFSEHVLKGDESARGASARTDPLSWQLYGRFLKSVGLAVQHGDKLELTPAGEAVRENPETEELAPLILRRMRMLAESLDYISTHEPKIEDLKECLKQSYAVPWKGLGDTRARIDWLEVLGLIESSGNRRWRSTPKGKRVLRNSILVSPESLEMSSKNFPDINKAPDEIQILLNELHESKRTHESRNTYNIWVPSPASDPNKVENLRTIINTAMTPIGREEFLQFVAGRFNLRRSSVDSMLPFLRASGIIEEIGLAIFQATSAARAWINSDDDVNFIRILHAHMRYIGEMIRTVEAGITRSAIYDEALEYGLNKEKSRWIASFLEDTELIEQYRHGSLRATTSGLELLRELPLAPEASIKSLDSSPADPPAEPESSSTNNVREKLVSLANSPNADGLGPGKAFENAVKEAFELIGFNAQQISGPGDTDVLVHWRKPEGEISSAIVEVKSRSHGSVTHTDVSDVALETHKNRNNANYTAIIGPGFTGGTIKNMAKTREWALIDADTFGVIIEAALNLGLAPQESGLMLQGPNGLSQVQQIIKRQQRDLDVITFVINQLSLEARETDEAITPRDIFRDGRKTDLAPSVDEILEALHRISGSAGEAVRVEQKQQDPRFSSYVLGETGPAARKLQALARAIEPGRLA